MPRTERELVVLEPVDGFADPAALWAWATSVIEAQRQAAVTLAAAPREDGEAAVEPSTSIETAVVQQRDPWQTITRPDDREGLPPVATSAESATPPAPESPGVGGGAAAAPGTEIEAPVLDDGLAAVEDALARSLGCTTDAASTRAVIVYALRRLGSERVHELLGVRLTAMRPDGLYGLAGADWRKIA